MSTLLLRAALVGFAALTATPALAAPVLSFEYTGSGQVVSPTGQVTVGGRLTNTGDTALYAAQTSFNFLLPTHAYDNYSWISGAFPKGPSTFIDLDPGESVDWTITILGTWPYPLPKGSPVPEGEYFLEVNTLKITYTAWDAITGPTGLQYLMSAAPSRFTWTVVAQTASVPAPGALLLLAGALIGMAGLRRRR